MNKHIIPLTGGLGNQLFQYCFGLELQKRANAFVTYDLGFYAEEVLSATPRSPSLAGLGLHFIEHDQSIHRIYSEFQNLSLARLNNRYPSVEMMRYALSLGILLISKKTILHARAPSRFWRLTRIIPINHYYIGNSQDSKYFSSNSRYILNSISPLSERLRVESSWSEKISKDDTVVIHVRRGDYALNPVTRNFHGLLRREYFISALQRLRESTAINHAFVFSDDIEWCKENLRLPLDTQFVSGSDKEMTDVEELMIMSQGSKFIISNSTFSWWAANLSTSSGKKVIAPARWFESTQAQVNMDRLKVSEWIYLDERSTQEISASEE